MLSPRTLLVALALTASIACKGSHKKAPPVNLAGIAAVPSTATVVVQVDVPRLASSPLIARAVDQLLLRDPELASRWQRLHDECKLEVTEAIQRVVLALGPKAAGATAPVLMVATGKVGETALSTCVRAMVGKGGGALSATTVGGRTLYQAKEGNRSMWFGFSQPDTVVLGSDQAFVTEALSAGKKVADNAELQEYMALADRKRAIWAVGQVDPAIGQRLLGPSGGTLKAGPRGFVVALDATDGAHVELGAVMASVDDAKALELLAKQQLGLFAMAAQAKALGHLVGKATAAAAGKVVRLSVTLDPTEINQLLSAVDSAGTGSQDAPPAAPSQPSP